MLRNYTLASKEEQDTIKNNYRVSNLRDKISIIHKTNPDALTQPFDDKEFRKIVKEVVSKLHHKERKVNQISKPVYYTQLSEQRKCPLYKVDPKEQITKIKK